MITEYKKFSDKELLDLYRGGDQWAFEEINERYKNVVRYHARFYYLTGGDGEDLLQEGMIGLFEATNTYRDDRNATFATFADMCIRSRIIKAVKSDNKKSNQPLNRSLPIEPEKSDKDERGEPVYSERFDSDGGIGNPERILIDEETNRLIVEKIMEQLSDFEGKIFVKYLEGKGLHEISSETDNSYKSVENAFSRIRGKVRKMSGELLN